jgi:hypothetical protein
LQPLLLFFNNLVTTPKYFPRDGIFEGSKRNGNLWKSDLGYIVVVVVVVVGGNSPSLPQGIE